MCKKEIHHTCRCTGQQFSFEEWCEWLDRHDGAGMNSSKFVVLSYNGFDFNIYDVCLTPNNPVDWKNKNCCYFSIKTAQSPNARWEYGISYSFHNTGGGYAATFVSNPDQGYSIEKEAIFAALLELEGNVNRELSESYYDRETDEEDEGMKNSSAIPYLRSALKQIGEFKQLFNPQQLSLF